MCKVRWLAHEHPAVVRGPWTEQERLDLKRAVEEAKRQPKSERMRPADDIQLEDRMEEDDEEKEENEDSVNVDWEVVAGFLGVRKLSYHSVLIAA